MIESAVMRDALDLAETLERVASRRGISVNGRIFMRNKAGAIKRVYQDVQENHALIDRDLCEQQFCWQVKFELKKSKLANDQFLQELDFLAAEMQSIQL